MLNILFHACGPGVAPVLGMEAQLLQLFTQCLASLAQVQLCHGEQGLVAVMGPRFQLWDL